MLYGGVPSRVVRARDFDVGEVNLFRSGKVRGFTEILGRISTSEYICFGTILNMV